MSGSVEETKKHVAAYMKVGAALGVLTVVTVAASYLPTAVPLAIVIALNHRHDERLAGGERLHAPRWRAQVIYWALGLTAIFWVFLMSPAIARAVGHHRRAEDAAKRQRAGDARR